MSTPPLDSTQSLNDILHDRPAAVAILHGYGLDTCCHGHESLAGAAMARGVDPERIVREIVALDAALSPATGSAAAAADLLPTCSCGCRHAE